MGFIKYLIAQEIDYKWGLVTTTVGLQEGAQGMSYPYGNHPTKYHFTKGKGRVLDEFQKVYIIKGSGWFESDHCSRTEIKAGNAFLLFPGEYHNYVPNIETGWSEAWIGFKGEYAEHLVRQGFFSRNNPVLKVGVHDSLWEIFRKAYDVAINQIPAYQQQLAGYCNLILSTVYAEDKQPTGISDQLFDKINLAKKYMNEHSHESITMEKVAQEIGMSYSLFRKTFKTYTGFSPGHYFLALKLTRSKEILLTEDLTCKEVAFQMGFDTVEHFHAIFRKYFGVSPAKFRKMRNVSNPLSDNSTI
ncbi:MAG: helix-turn-helix domain-containing protein [Bacteroidaceae bacterium]|nr:helix-turn-helix domain-containing protein [Bacteroidaceae bacterium]